jgi:hypothetical protein
MSHGTGLQLDPKLLLIYKVNFKLERIRLYGCPLKRNATLVGKPIVEWWKLVWFSLAIPKQAFILWLAICNGLTAGRGVQAVAVAVICS